VTGPRANTAPDDEGGYLAATLLLRLPRGVPAAVAASDRAGLCAQRRREPAAAGAALLLAFTRTCPGWLSGATWRASSSPT